MKIAHKLLVLSLMVLPVVAPPAGRCHQLKTKGHHVGGSVVPQTLAQPQSQPALATATITQPATIKEVVTTRPTFPPNLQLTEWQPVPSPRAIYGRPSHYNATPYPTCKDSFYSGDAMRPGPLDAWFGNGYSF